MLDLDTALKFAENQMIAQEAEERMTESGGEDLFGEEGGGAVDESPNTFDDMVASVCATSEEERVFRDAWLPIEFLEGQVISERGEVADRIYFIEDAVVRVEMARWGECEA